MGGIDFAYIGKVLLFLLGMYLLSAAFSFIQGWLMSGLSQKVCYDFRDQISKKINRLPLAYFESAPSARCCPALQTTWIRWARA